MRYSKMVCWVNEQKKMFISKANEQKINIAFVDNKNDFLNQLDVDVFPVVSVYETEGAYDIVRSFSKIRFYLFFQDVGEVCLPLKTYAPTLLELNVSPDSKHRSVFNANELILLFGGQDIAD